jgi:hypothetical protein
VLGALVLTCRAPSPLPRGSVDLSVSDRGVPGVVGSLLTRLAFPRVLVVVPALPRVSGVVTWRLPRSVPAPPCLR